MRAQSSQDRPDSGQDEFLLSGEFHYFRVPREAWRDRLRRCRDLGLAAISIYVPWNWHERAPEDLDFVGGTDPETNLLGALEEIAAEGLRCIYRPGPFITAEWRGGGLPDWLWQRTPEIRARDATGRFAGPYHPYPALTYAHPGFVDPSCRWLNAALEAAAPYLASHGGPIVNVQLDDEPSYWQLLEEDPLALDYNPYLVEGAEEDAVSRYGRWLLERHGELDRLNAAHRTRLNRLEDIGPPREPMGERAELSRFADWLDFKLSMINEYVARLHETALAAGVDVPVSMLFPYLAPLNAAKFADFASARGLDLHLTDEVYLGILEPSTCPEQKLGAVVAAHEHYNMWRGDGPGPPTCMELQASHATYITPEDMEELYAITVARGIQAINFYMMVGGRNPEGFGNESGQDYDLWAPIALDGSLRPHSEVIRKLSQTLQANASWILGSSPMYDTWLGCYVPYETAALSSGKGNMSDASDLLSSIFGGENMEAMSLQSLMTLSSVSFGCLDVERAPDAELADARQLWLHALDFMSAAVQERLVTYAREGGHLVILPTIPRLGSDMEPCEILLREVFGEYSPAELPGMQAEREVFCRIRTTHDEHLVCPGRPTAFPVPAGARPIAWNDDDGGVCAFSVDVGRGRISVLGFRLQYMPFAAPDQKMFVARFVEDEGAGRHAWTSSYQTLAMQLAGPRSGLVCVVNPVGLEVSTKVTYHVPGSEERRTFPSALEGLRFHGRGARLLTIGADVGAGITLRHSTWELTNRHDDGEGVDLRYESPEAIGEIAFEGGDIEVKVGNGRVVTSDVEAGASVLVIEASDASLDVSVRKRR